MQKWMQICLYASFSSILVIFFLSNLSKSFDGFDIFAWLHKVTTTTQLFWHAWSIFYEHFQNVYYNLHVLFVNIVIKDWNNDYNINYKMPKGEAISVQCSVIHHCSKMYLVDNLLINK